MSEKSKEGIFIRYGRFSAGGRLAVYRSSLQSAALALKAPGQIADVDPQAVRDHVKINPRGRVAARGVAACPTRED